MNRLPHALANITTIPLQLKVETADSIDQLMAHMGRVNFGQAGRFFLGNAYVQGGRLMFTTSTELSTLLAMALIEQAPVKATVAEVIRYANRPFDATHGKRFQDYLLSTAATGDKFIFPSFTLNFGVLDDEDAPQLILTLVIPNESAIVWPALLFLPAGSTLHVTDGWHRLREMSRLPDGVKNVLSRNAATVTIVFEASASDSHQDFADCGKAKAIQSSLLVTYDVRDWRNRRSRELVMAVPFLRAYVDATAHLVNLSAKSRKIWSMSAVRMAISHIVDAHPNQLVDNDAKTVGLEEFFGALVKYLPQLRALDAVRDELYPALTTGKLREDRGGDIALRGVGMAVFARAFLFCASNNVSFDVMAEKLATLDWHILNRQRTELLAGDSDALRNAVQPIWEPLLVIGEDRYRVSASSIQVNHTWSRIEQQLFQSEQLAAAE
jgi:hypothetical protein